MAFALTTLTSHVPDYIAPSIPPLVLTIIIASLCVKLYFIATLCYKGFNAQTAHRSLSYLLATLFFSLFSDMAWAAKFIHKIFLPSAPYSFVTFFIRLGWSSIALQHQYLSLFMQGLIQQKVQLSKVQKTVTAIAYFFCFYFVYTAFFDPHLTDKTAQLMAQKIIFNPPFEVIMVRLSTFYLVAVLVIPGIRIVLEHAHNSTLPNIVKKQFFIFLLYFVCPYLAIELLQGIAIIFSIMERSLYVIVGLATLLLIIALYYAINRIIFLRFMNWNSEIQSDPTISQLPFFISTLKQLSFAHNKAELTYITEQFFKTAFNISEKNVALHIPHESATQAIINALLAPAPNNAETFSARNYLKQHRILIFDNITCSHFYEPSDLYQEIIQRMIHLDADVFIPLYQKEAVIGCIVIKKSAHTSCFNKTDRDKMIVFAHYLSSNIHLIATKNHDTLISRMRAATGELQAAQQEINLFKEAVRHAMKTEHPKKIGVLYFQNNILTTSSQVPDFFYPLNQSSLTNYVITNYSRTNYLATGHPVTSFAQHALNQHSLPTYSLNQYALNQYDKLPLIRAIKQVARKVAATKVAHAELFITEKHDYLLISGSGQLNKKEAALICVQHASHADIIQKYSNIFSDPTDWYYLLFLKTTQIGHQITSYLKASTDYFECFKLQLLKKLVGSSSLFIHVHEKDMPPLIAAITQLHTTTHSPSSHAISHAAIHAQSPALQTVTIQIESPATAHTITPLIFGDKTHPGLLNSATLMVIINAHWLLPDTQRAISAYLQEKKSRFIFVSSESIQHAYFERDFYLTLKNNILTIPSPDTLAPEELAALVDGITQQLLADTLWQSALTLSPREKKSLTAKPPKSLYTLQKNIYDIIQNKIRHNTQNGALPSTLPSMNGSETEDITSTSASVTAIKQVSYLGKYALQDPEAMKLLWHSFGNHHTIGRILSVDTASVYRAYKKYGLL